MINIQDSFVHNRKLIEPSMSFTTYNGEPIVRPTVTLENYEKLLINELSVNQEPDSKN